MGKGIRAVLLCRFTLIFAAVTCATPLLAQHYKYPFLDPRLPVEKRIDNILSLMTVNEKIDCLGVPTGVPRLGIPSYGASEGIHGVVQRGGYIGIGGLVNRPVIPTTQFPQPAGMGETWDPELVRQAGAVEGHEARFITQTPKYDRRILMLWGPQSDLARDPRWGRSEEVYGEDPFFNGTMAVSFVKGLQGDNPRYWQAAALVKHFLANSNENGRTHTSSNFDQRLFWEYYSVPFRMAFLDADAKAVMASYNAWNDTPMAINPILRSIVVKQWHVDVLSSDAGAVADLVTQRHLFATQQEAVVACLKAGINQFLEGYKDQTEAALKDGSVNEHEIDDLLRPKFRITIRLGLLDPPALVPYSTVKDSPEPWNTVTDRAVSKKMALESVVLLKNDNGFLPLSKSITSIAVIGPLADSVHWDWYGGEPPYAITPLEGIKAEVGPGVNVRYVASALANEAVRAARESDVAVVVVGNDPTCGPDMEHDWDNLHHDGSTLPCTVPSDGREGRDRESISLGQEEELIEQVYAVNPKTVVVLVSSFPYAINWTEAHVPAILHMTHASQDEGTAVAQVVFGDYNPGGHLTTTWPQSLDQLPPKMDYNIRDGRTYMYFKGKPLYPFGYGLSYSTFSYSNLKTSSPHLAKDGTLTVSVDLKNTGHRAGDAVVQLYVTHLGSKVERPAEELRGFQRVSLQPDETRSVQIQLNASNLTYWDEKLQRFVLETEPVELAVGDSSADIKLRTHIRVQ
jgi:beta-glucosidase